MCWKRQWPTTKKTTTTCDNNKNHDYTETREQHIQFARRLLWHRWTDKRQTQTAHTHTHTPSTNATSELSSLSGTLMLRHAVTLRLSRSCTHTFTLHSHALRPVIRTTSFLSDSLTHTPSLTLYLSISGSFALTQIQIGCFQCADLMWRRFKRYQSVVSLARFDDKWRLVRTANVFFLSCSALLALYCLQQR